MVNILGIKIYDKDVASLLQTIGEICKGADKNNYCISCTSVHGVIHAQSDNDFRTTLNSFYANVPDGKPLTWIGKLKDHESIQQITGSLLFKTFFEYPDTKNLKHFFCGGKAGIAASLRDVMINDWNYSGGEIGVYSPPFREMTDTELQALGQQINSYEPDIVWIGISTPKQELFAKRLSAYTNVHFIITVGAVFDFYTGGVKRAPKFVTAAGLEWVYRLAVEPRRLWPRYTEIVPKFIYFNLKELLKSFNKKQRF